LDTGFDDDGFSILELGTGESGIFDLVLQPDNKIVAVGYYFTGIGQQGPMNSAMVRINPDGSPDNNFGVSGTVITDTDPDSDQYSTALVFENGGILCGGSSYTSFCLAKYKSTIELGILIFNSLTPTMVSPNPVTPDTALQYTLLADGLVTIELFDLHGKKIQTLLNNKQTSGTHRQVLDLPPDLATGTYLVVLSTPKSKVTVKIIK
jgi:hypothetical protein